jgi:hypothetical protein
VIMRCGLNAPNQRQDECQVRRPRTAGVLVPDGELPVIFWV